MKKGRAARTVEDGRRNDKMCNRRKPGVAKSAIS